MQINKVCYISLYVLEQGKLYVYRESYKQKREIINKEKTYKQIGKALNKKEKPINNLKKFKQ